MGSAGRRGKVTREGGLPPRPPRRARYVAVAAGAGPGRGCWRHGEGGAAGAYRGSRGVTLSPRLSAEFEPRGASWRLPEPHRGPGRRVLLERARRRPVVSAGGARGLGSPGAEHRTAPYRAHPPLSAEPDPRPGRAAPRDRLFLDGWFLASALCGSALFHRCLS